MAFDYIPLWDRYRELFEPLEFDEIGRLVIAMQDYKDGKSVEITGNERFVWPSIRRDIDSAKVAYEETCKRQRENGAKGGRPKKADAYDENPKNPVVFAETQKSKNKAISKQSNINNTSPNGEGDTRAKRFTPPTLAEVQSYVAERQSPVDPQGFLDFYASKGWMVGKTPMKDWKAACRNAEKWDRWNRTAGKPRSPNNMVGVDFQPTAEQVKKNNDWLDAFLASQKEA